MILISKQLGYAGRKISDAISSIAPKDSRTIELNVV